MMARAMKAMGTWMLLLGGLVMATACGAGTHTAPDPTPLPASMEESGDDINLQLTRDERGVAAELDASADAVFRILPEIYGELDIEPDLIDTRGRRYGSNSVSGLRVGGEPMYELVRCGAQASGLQASTRMRVTLTVISTVEPITDRHSSLITRITAAGSRIDGTSTGAIACVSTGRLEEMIAGRARLLVAGAGGR